jgi:hypothetical protein
MIESGFDFFDPIGRSRIHIRLTAMTPKKMPLHSRAKAFEELTIN